MNRVPVVFDGYFTPLRRKTRSLKSGKNLRLIREPGRGIAAEFFRGEGADHGLSLQRIRRYGGQGLGWAVLARRRRVHALDRTAIAPNAAELGATRVLPPAEVYRARLESAVPRIASADRALLQERARPGHASPLSLNLPG